MDWLTLSEQNAKFLHKYLSALTVCVPELELSRIVDVFQNVWENALIINSQEF